MPRGERFIDVHQRAFELGFVDLAGAVQIDVDRQRLGDADRVGELQRAAVGEAGGDDVLGEIARGVGGRAVDLGRVLAGEGAAAMRRRAAVGVDDDLAAGEAAVAVGTADEELAGRVDVPDRLRGDPALRQRLERRKGSTIVAHVVGGEIVDRDAGARRRSASPRPACRSRSAPSPGSWRRARAACSRLPACARFARCFEDLVGVVDRRRHQLRRLAAGVAEHDALVARALVLVAGRRRRPGRCRRTARAAALRPWRRASGSLPARSRCP